MTDPHDDELLRLAEAVTDGARIDWTATPGRDSERLRLIERVTRAYAEPVAPAPPEPFALPERIGRFPVQGVLGRGGVGVVYRARDPRLERPVALKVLPPTTASRPGARERFAREARMLAAVHHPNIGVIYGIEDDADGAAILVLELVQGESLAARLRRGALPVREALEVAADIAEALVAAHSEGVTHGDLKPGNVMIESRGRARVLDFGLAWRGDAPGDAEPDDASVLGTAGYLAPECLTGTGDARSDLFSLGAVLYECLSGEPTFPGETSDAILAAEIAGAVDLARLPAATPPTARELVASCLSRDPARRPASAADCLATLRQLLEGRAAAPGPGNLPTPTTAFIGRERECREYATALARERLLTLTGVGGCGKTRLAVEVGRRARDRFPDGVWFVDLVRAGRDDEVAAVIAASLGVRAEGGGPLAEAIAAHLASARALLLLDNAEHVREGTAALTADLLPRCPGLTVLVTSRQALGLPDERVLLVPVLELPSEGAERDLESVARGEAVALFVDRAQRAAPDFAFDRGSAPAVVRIVRALEGLPLAIELAAARVPVLTPSQIVARLDRPLALLRGESPTAVRRHATMRTALAWSADLLLPDEAEGFRRLAPCVGWDLDAACVVAQVDDPLVMVDVIARLADKSLVVVTRRTGRPARYRMLEPVRELALERLIAAGEEQATRSRHAAHFLALAERAEPELIGTEMAAWLERLDQEHANLQAAFEWMLSSEREGALRMAGALWRFWHLRGHRAVGYAACRRALAAAGPAAAAWPRARALFASAALRPYTEADQIAGIPEFEEAARLYEEAGDRREQARALNGLALSYSSRFETAKARPIFERALALYREVGDTRGVSSVLHNLARDAWLQHDLPEVEGRLREVAEISGAGSDTRILAQVNLGLIRVRLGRLDAARKTLGEGYPELRRLGMRHDHGALGLVAAAELAEREGRDVDSARLFGATQAVLDLIGLRLTGEDIMWHEGDAAMARLRARLGAERFEAALAAGRALAPEEALSEAERQVG